MTISRPLPDGWRWVRFGDVVREVREATRDPDADGLNRVVGLDHLDSGDLRVTRWDELADRPDGTSFTRIFRAGQVLFGKRRAYQRKVAMPDFDGICSGDILVFEPSSKALIPKFLPYLVQSEGFFEHALGTSAGSLSPRTKWQDLAKYEFAIPPLPDQALAVELMEAADDASAAYERVRHALVDVKRALVEELVTTCSGEFDALEDLADVQYGLTIGPARRQMASEAPYLRVANVQRASIDLSQIKFVGVSDEDRTRFRLKAGDILVVEGHANREEVGRSAIWLETEQEMLHQNHLIRVRSRGAISPRVLVELLNSDLGRQYFASNAKSTSGLNTINSTVVRRFPVPRADLAALVDAAEQFVAVESASDRASAALTSLSQLRSALLDELLGAGDV